MKPPIISVVINTKLSFEFISKITKNWKPDVYSGDMGVLGKHFKLNNFTYILPSLRPVDLVELGINYGNMSAVSRQLKLLAM